MATLILYTLSIAVFWRHIVVQHQVWIQFLCPTNNVNQCEKISFSFLNFTLVTSCMYIWSIFLLPPIVLDNKIGISLSISFCILGKKPYEENENSSILQIIFVSFNINYKWETFIFFIFFRVGSDLVYNKKQS